MLVVAFTLSIGPEISLGATGVPMPHYLLGMHLVPFVERLWFPYRWIVVAMLAACMAAGILVSRLPSKWRGVAAMSAIGLGLYPQVRAGVYPLTATHWSMSPVYREIGEREGGVVELPLMVPRESLMFRPIHKQVLFGGMGENAPVFWPRAFRDRMRNDFIRFLRTAVRSESVVHPFEQTDLERIREDGFRWIVLDRHALMRAVAQTGWYRASSEAREGAPERTVFRITEAIGSPVAADGPLVVWDLEAKPVFPEPLTPTVARLEGFGWAGIDWVSYEATLEAELRREGVFE